MTGTGASLPGWEAVRQRLCAQEPSLYELEPGGALALHLNEEGWLLELTPDGQLICQTGMDIDDLKVLLSEGTCEDLGTDEIAKQAKGLMNRTVSRHRPALLREGFEERTEMNEQYVAVTFSQPIDLRDVDQLTNRIRWCQRQFAG
ncbi:hypothetical protein YTPLAS18_13140 [Nitrospira sp.]|nr:hypothetical protein YTPLAS18_13140 [Nitrospira sp.]